MRTGLRLLLGVVGGVVAVLYPVAVWVGLQNLSARGVGVWLLVLLAPLWVSRLRRMDRATAGSLLPAPLAVLGLVLLTTWLDDPRYVFLLPVCINLSLFVSFGVSLRPSATPIIARFAELMERQALSPAQMRHCRQMTWGWVCFFALNAAVCAALALFASPFVWALYTGGIAYALMGLLFAGEYVLRQYRFRRYGKNPVDRLLRRVFPPPSVGPS